MIVRLSITGNQRTAGLIKSYSKPWYRTDLTSFRTCRYGLNDSKITNYYRNKNIGGIMSVIFLMCLFHQGLGCGKLSCVIHVSFLLFTCLRSLEKRSITIWAYLEKRRLLSTCLSVTVRMAPCCSPLRVCHERKWVYLTSSSSSFYGVLFGSTHYLHFWLNQFSILRIKCHLRMTNKCTVYR